MSRETPFVDFPAGSPVLRENEAAGALFIIEAGKVAIERGGVPIAELGPGDVFGEAALLQEQGHGASAVARTAVRALRLDTATLPAVLRENVDVAMQLLRRLAQRLRAAEQRVSAPAPAGAHPPAVAGDAQARAQRVDQAAAAASAAPPPAASASMSTPGAGAASTHPAGSASAAAAPAIPAGAASASGVSGLAPGLVPGGAPKHDPIDTRPRTETVAPAPSGAPAPTAQSVPNGPPVVSHVLRHAQGVIALPGDKAECLVGRPDPATGAIPEINLGPLDLARSLSRRHARLFVTGNTVSLREEPGVANGTWVNGERLAAGQQVMLKPGDKLRFGAIELEFGTA